MLFANRRGQPLFYFPKPGGILERLHKARCRERLWLSIAETDRRAELIEAGFVRLPDVDQVHAEWRRLVVVHSVIGVKVHDARLVAAMHVHGITHVLTLNEKDFRRYPGITIAHPRDFAKP